MEYAFILLGASNHPRHPWQLPLNQLTLMSVLFVLAFDS